MEPRGQVDVAQGANCASCVQAGLVCNQQRPCERCVGAGTGATCSLRRKRGRPRKVKPDPNAPKPTPPPPKPLLPLCVARPPAPAPPASSMNNPEARTHTSATGKRKHVDGNSDDELHEKKRGEDGDDDDDSNLGRVGAVAVSTMVPSVLQLLVDELRDIRRSVKGVKKDVSRLSSQQLSLADRHQGLVQTLDALPVTSAPASSSSLGSPWQSRSSSLQAFASPQPQPQQSYYLAPGVAELFPHLTLPARAARLEFLRQFPFLERFNLATRDTPFVIDDLRKPMAFSRAWPDFTRGVMPTPIFVYANPAFCALTQYELHELQGCAIDKVAMTDQANKPTFLHHLTHRPHEDMTGVLHFSSLARTKHNLIFKAHLRWQVFIDTQGNSLWSFTCVDRVEPASHEELRAHSPLLGHDIESFLVMFPSCSPFSDASSASSPSASSS